MLTCAAIQSCFHFSIIEDTSKGHFLILEREKRQDNWISMVIISPMQWSYYWIIDHFSILQLNWII